ncbi:MAG: UDP-N-acetylmuramoyl-L-alanyl-D-glutamate--2,6-diaminopimelate ligase [Lentisphaeria bacterium]|nr:UDP-N-acetylmuramoyl-L-alanyl-D-glutamate--2,6-diaminopimelate ligase [Lentisphaeria bacterium]
MSICKKILGELLAAEYHVRSLPSSFTADSRKVVPGTGFAAIPGSRMDGHDFIPAALEKGASLIMMEKELPLPPGTPALLVRDCAAAFALMVRHCAGEPDLSLELMGVTGTNGKTTTAFLLEHIFNASRRPCGLISTVEYRTGAGIVPGDRTTPDSETLFGLFKSMKESGLKYAAMELSSHSLVQNRAAGIKLRAAIFTNLTGDHLDYHGNMENYYQAKKRLFTDFLHPQGMAVINTDDPGGARLSEELEGICRCVTFSSGKKSDCRIKDIRLERDGAAFVLEHPLYGELPLSSNLTGFYNIQNLAGAAIAALECGIAPEELLGALKKKIRVPGRLEAFQLSGGGCVYVDYAHTDDALINVLKTLRNITPGKLYVLFGAGGDRDRTKRPRMGKAAAVNADFLFVTSDNPRSEEPEKIIEEILTGVPAGTSCQVIPDRAEAIRKALEMTGAGDSLLIAGKGHETYQEIKGEKLHFSDMEEIEKFIREKSL